MGGLSEPKSGRARGGDVEVFSTCPQSSDHDAREYRRRVIDVARWSERHGCTGILVYTDNRLADPWLVAQVIVESTERLQPLVAVQPVYMHPYSLAKMISSIGLLYGRRLALNMVAGGFRNDLAALDDTTAHDERYRRVVEHTRIALSLLEGKAPVTVQGAYYRVTNLSLSPALPPEIFPGVFVSGSSEMGIEAARALGATAVMYPKPPGEAPEPARLGLPKAGIRVGIVARESEDEAWRIARERFPEDRKGQLTHQLAMKVSDSVWHRDLSRMGERLRSEPSPYWLVPFENYRTFCPYLVGSYVTVANEIGRYIALGYRTFILDIPPAEEELEHTGIVFSAVRRGAGA